MNRLQLTAAVVISSLSGPVLAHGGLDEQSAVMVAVHNLAHAISAHPVISVLLGAVIISGFGWYRSVHGSRRN